MSVCVPKSGMSIGLAFLAVACAQVASGSVVLATDASIVDTSPCGGSCPGPCVAGACVRVVSHASAERDTDAGLRSH